MRVLVLADLEGASGFDGPVAEHEAAGAGFMAGDINAAVRGLVRAGASAVDVADTHGMGGNVDPVDVDAPGRLLAGAAALAELLMRPGAARSYAAWVLGAGTAPGMTRDRESHSGAPHGAARRADRKRPGGGESRFSRDNAPHETSNGRRSRTPGLMTSTQQYIQGVLEAR